MVKKKARNVPAPEPVDTEPTCKHIRKGLEEGAVKKALVNVDWTLCQDCQAESKDKIHNEDEEQAEAQVIWLCLKCGHRGCGRYSERQHALNHYNTPRSEPHCLVLSVGDWNAWCYLCDSEVQYNNSGRLRQLVDFIQKKSKTNVKDSNTVQPVQDDLHSEYKEREEHQVVEDPNVGVQGAKAVNTLSDNKEMTVKGLSNLGNTCFFNAVMQNLSQTPTLRELLNEVKQPGKAVTVKVPDDPQPTPREVMLEQQPGPLTLAMWQFLTEMQETKKGVVTPKELFSQVCKKAIRFKGYQQQDSQELLRYLLDGMRGEEIQRVSSAISKTLQAASERIEEEEVKRIVKDCEKRRAIPNFVDRLFGGELTSTIMCETCHTVSLVHEPFLDLSLPVLDDLPAKKNTAKSAKAVNEKKNEEESDNDSYVKDRNDLPSGPSKHLQKKAKKQAKKQAKNQRRQQKIQDKILPLNDSNVSQSNDDDSILDNNNMLDNNCEQQEETLDNRLSSSITIDVDMEMKEEDLGHLESKESCQTNMENNLEADSKSFESQHNSVTEDQENSPDLIPISPHKIKSSLENEGQPSNKLTAVVENGDVSQENIDSDEVQEKRSPSPPAEDDAVDSLLTENLNRLNLSSDLERLNLNTDLEPNDIEIQIIDGAPTTQIYEVVNEDPKTAFCTLADRKELQLAEWSVLSCLYQFTRKEDLVGNNQLLCNTCTQRQAKTMRNNNKEKKFVYTNAKKQMLVSAPPPILTLHLKRFQQNGFNLHKINKHIKFPEVIDLAPFSTVKCKNIREGEERLLYSLYGVIEHSGTMRSGHYTAYVKSRTPNPHLCDLVLRGLLPDGPSTEPTKGHWFHISDSHVQAVPLNKVLNSQAYLLFYERIL